VLYAAWRMIRFETDPRVLPRHEAGPLFLMGIPAFVTAALPINGVGFMTVFALVCWTCALEAQRPVSGALNALLYLLCLGTLVVNVPVLLFAPAQHPSWQFGAWLAGTMFLVTAIVSARPVIRREFLRRDHLPSLGGGGRHFAEPADDCADVESGVPRPTEGVEKP